MVMTLRVAIALALLGATAGAAGEAGVPAVPAGMVAFFAPATTACPDGWSAADFAQGRALVGVTAQADVGLEVGTPLGDREQRTHAHNFTGAAVLAVKSISAADGGNNSGAAARSYAVSGTSEPSAGALPFAQLFLCEKP